MLARELAGARGYGEENPIPANISFINRANVETVLKKPESTTDAIRWSEICGGRVAGEGRGGRGESGAGREVNISEYNNNTQDELEEKRIFFRGAVGKVLRDSFDIMSAALLASAGTLRKNTVDKKLS